MPPPKYFDQDQVAPQQMVSKLSSCISKYGHCMGCSNAHVISYQHAGNQVMKKCPSSRKNGCKTSGRQPQQPENPELYNSLKTL